MKKIFVVFVSLFLSISSTSYSYSNEYFSISTTLTPEILYEDETIIYTFAFNNGLSMIITVAPHNSKYADNDFDQSHIDTYAKTISDFVSNSLNTSTEIKAKNKVSFGKKPYNAIKIDIYMPEYNHFMRQYLTNSDKYVYSITLSCTDLMYLKQLSDTANTFSISDTVTENGYVTDWTVKIVVCIVIMAISAFISYMKKRNKKLLETSAENTKEGKWI